MATRISNLACVDPRAELGDNVEIGPFCHVGPDAKIGDDTRLESNVVIKGRVIMGQNNHVHPGAVIGGEPQDVSYGGTRTCVLIGDDNTIRECVTINRASEKEDGITKLGSNCFLMASAHIAHDCKIGDNLVMANGSMLGGHVHVANSVTISGSRRRPSFHFDRQLQLHRRPQPRIARCSSLHVGRGESDATTLCQRRRLEAKQLSAGVNPRFIGSSSLAVPLAGRRRERD